MVEAIFGLMAMGGAMWLAIYAVDSFIAWKRRGWRYSLRDLVILMTVVCVMFGALLALKQLFPHYVNFHGPTF
jgi:hypothetical protein